jgi:hypothetical protein
VLPREGVTMDDYTDDELLKAAGVRRSGVGRAAEGALAGILAILPVGGVIVARIATFLGAVGLVLKFFGAAFMQSWDWSTLIWLLLTSTIAWFVTALFADA